MGRTKDLFISERERKLQEANDCDGNCLDCIKTCDVTQHDIEVAIQHLNEESDYE